MPDKIYIVQKGCEILDEGYTSLKRLCNEQGLPYGSVTKGTMGFIKGGIYIKIMAISILKIKGRGNNNLKK